MIEHLFAPVVTHAHGLPDERTYSGFVATTTFPVDAAVHGFTVQVAPRTRGFDITITCPALGDSKPVTATAGGSTWIRALIECRFQLLAAVDRAEVQWRRQLAKEAA